MTFDTRFIFVLKVNKVRAFLMSHGIWFQINGPLYRRLFLPYSLLVLFEQSPSYVLNYDGLLNYPLMERVLLIVEVSFISNLIHYCGSPTFVNVTQWFPI